MNDESDKRKGVREGEKNLSVKCKFLPNWTPKKSGQCKRWILCRMDGMAGSDGCPAKGGA